MEEVDAKLAPKRVSAEIVVEDPSPEKPPRRKAMRFGSLMKRLSMDINSNANGSRNGNTRIAALEMKNAELVAKSAELERVIQQLQARLDESSQVTERVKTELLARCDALSRSNVKMTDRIQELTDENEGLKKRAEEAEDGLEEAREEIGKAKTDVADLEAKLATSKRPFFAFGTKSTQAPRAREPPMLSTRSLGAGQSPLMSPQGSLMAPRNRSSMDASESWYDRFCGRPAIARTSSTSTATDTPRGHDSVDSWYGRFCGLAKGK